MLKKLVVALLVVSPLLAHAQCDGCVQIPSQKIDFCFKNDLFSGMCLQFADKLPHFYLDRKKSSVLIPAPKEEENLTAYLLSLTDNKKLKMTSREILFVQAGLEKWKIEQRKIGYTFEPNGLGIKVLKEGTGEYPEKGRNVVVHYTGTLLDGKKFDSSLDRGQPFKFPLGQGRVIRGWDEGIAKLKVGTKALLYIPPDMGYGSRGAGAVIPPDATLIFEVELLGVE
ncbi:MAG: FKBP-type peptidyl-prolyl cis-trans isomerase [Flammeovirgaceae bacterium]|nr:FKBP-type peptidyl-prolyl cis-trans isomerase [Flammeovirgaceae bacterium]MDW8288975.1 FKBP-type peptidyl-prolyl cis-trans isomerase [Flammeovirgaceae bacterium]